MRSASARAKSAAASATLGQAARALVSIAASVAARSSRSATAPARDRNAATSPSCSPIAPLYHARFSPRALYVFAVAAVRLACIAWFGRRLPGGMLPHVRGRGGDSEPTTACLSEDVVVGFLDGTLAGAERERVELHVDACAACFGWLAAMIRSSLLQSRGVLADTLPLGDSPPLIGDGGSGQVAPGTMIGRYRVVGQLGQGAMGVVHRAFDPMLEREVAIKVLRGGASSGVRLRALDEAQALAKLQHPNVIALYDVGFFADQVFVAMERVEGGTLADWLQERRPWRKVRDLFLQAARGLGAAHAAGLVHRDFKPANVLLTADGARVVVTDFGLVCSLDVDRPPTSGELAGTPAYMAPEQFAGGAIDPRTDIFNFCAALYEALFGQPAFAGD